MAESTVDGLLKKYPILSDQVDARELRVILHELDAQMQVTPGAVVEFGCYVGTTSLFIRRVLDWFDGDAVFHVYDSFQGLPPKTAHDISPAGEQFKTGELLATRKTFEMNFKKANLRLPKIHKCWFDELVPDDVPTGVTFAYLDGDYYESIKDSLRVLEGSLRERAVIVVDDYANEALPGAKKAVDEWLVGRRAKLRVQSSLAVIYLA